MEFLNLINDKTMYLAYAITHIMILLVLLIIYPIYKKKYLLVLLTGYILTTIGLTLTVSREVLPTFLSISMSNIIVIGGNFFLLKGFLDMIGRKMNHRIWVLLTAIYGIIHIYFIYLLPNMNARIINISLFSIIISAILIFNYTKNLIKKFDLAIFLIVFSYTLGSLTILWRLINVLFVEEVSILFRNAPILKVHTLVAILASILQIISIIAYNTRDLIE